MQSRIEWKEVKFQDLASFLSGFAFTSSDYSNKGLKLIRIQNLGNNKNEKFVCWDKEYNPKYIIKKGDLLLSLSGTVPVSFKIFKWNKEDALLNQRIVKIKLNEKNINESYLSYNIQKNLIKIYSKATSTTGIANVKIDVIKSLKILLPFLNGKPDLEEQERIVSILEKAEKQKERSEKAERLLNEYLKSVFNEMFYNKGFEEVQLGDENICEIIGEYGSGAGAIEYDGKTRYIRITDIGEDGKLRNELVSPSIIEDKYLLKFGDLLFARTGATVGKTYLHSSDKRNYQYAGYLIRFRFNKNIIPEYVYYFTKTNKYLNWVASTQKVVAQPNINAKQYSSLKIPLPPLPFQQKFTRIVKHVEGLKENIKKTKRNSEELFDSLMTKAFRGEL